MNLLIYTIFCTKNHQYFSSCIVIKSWKKKINSESMNSKQCLKKEMIINWLINQLKVVGNIGWKKYVIKKLNKIIMHSRHQWFVPWKFFISDDDPPPPNHTSSQQSYYNLNQNCLLKPNWQSRKVITRTYGRLFWQFSLAPGPLPNSMLYMYIHNKHKPMQTWPAKRRPIYHVSVLF